MAIGYAPEQQEVLPKAEYCYNDEQLYMLTEGAQDAFDASIVAEHPKFMAAVEQWTEAEYHNMVAKQDTARMSDAARLLVAELQADDESPVLFIAATLYSDLWRLKEETAEQLALMRGERSCDTLQLHADLFRMECQKHL